MRCLMHANISMFTVDSSINKLHRASVETSGYMYIYVLMIMYTGHDNHDGVGDDDDDDDIRH